MKRLYISANRRHLVDETGRGVFLLGDTGWEFFYRCTESDATYYLDHRQRQGFNWVLACVLPEANFLQPSAIGQLALIDNDPLQPNPAYFAHIDTLIDMAAARGIYVGVLPTWGDKVSQAWGVGPVILTARNAEAYGAMLARRWRDRDNIVYVLGGDRNPVRGDVDTALVWRAMGRGIRREVGNDVLITYHPQGGFGSSRWFHHDDWIDFHLSQSGHMAPDAPIWEWITADYALIPPKPTMDGEPNYEDHPINPFTRQWLPEYGRFGDHDVRKQGYRSVFAGAAGHVYGHHTVWQMWDETRAPINFPDPDWRAAVMRPAAEQIGQLRSLIESRPMLERIPDQDMLLSDAGSGGSHIRACRDANGTYALVYIPTADTSVTVDPARLKGETVRAAWFDPRTGETTAIGSFPTGAPAAFVTPATAPDWVLTLDAEKHAIMAG